MEQRPQKKQIKKYVYNIRCEPRTLRPCHTFNVAKMSTHCEPEFYDKCQVVPHEKCQEVPKEACFKEPVMVKRTKCSSGPTSSDFSTTISKLSENSFTADQYQSFYDDHLFHIFLKQKPNKLSFARIFILACQLVQRRK